MLDLVFLFIAAVFLLAGFVKGVIGLGLPTISMGLLALVVAPAEAAAILVVPSLVTNIWQMLDGARLGAVWQRLWPMLLGVSLGTWAGAGLMTGSRSGYGTALLGVALVLYAASGLASVRYSITPRHETWLGPLAGAVTGLISAATGVFVIPAVPYLQAIGLEKDDLVQALGLSFTVSTAALAFNLASAGVLNSSIAGVSIAALVTASAGMWIGQLLRRTWRPQVFRLWFFIALLVLGAYLVVRSLV